MNEVLVYVLISEEKEILIINRGKTSEFDKEKDEEIETTGKPTCGHPILWPNGLTNQMNLVDTDRLV